MAVVPALLLLAMLVLLSVEDGVPVGVGVEEGDATQKLAPGSLPLPAGQAVQNTLPVPAVYEFSAQGAHSLAPGAPE